MFLSLDTLFSLQCISLPSNFLVLTRYKAK